MHIHIPTLGREDRQITLKSIPDRWKSRTFLVCPASENHPSWPDEQRKSVPEYAIGSISKTRQWIVENSNSRKCGMIDDDISFYKVDPITRYKRKKIGPEDVGVLFDLMNDWLDTDVFCGTSHPFMSQNNPVEYYFGKTAWCYFFDSQYLLEKQIRYDQLAYFEDFHVPLCVLESGRRLRYTGDYVTQEFRANAPGGCSINRTAINNQEAMIELKNLHPRYIDLKIKEGATNQTLEVGLAMRIAFKKCHDENASDDRLSF